MDERALVLSCRERDPGQLESLVEMYENPLYRFCFHLCRDVDGAAELYQDTWVKALSNLHKYKAKGSFLGWLFTIAVNLQRDKYRRRQRRERILAECRMELAVPNNNDADYGLKMLIQETLEKMDDSLRIPVTLFYFEDYNLDDIAEVLGIPVGTVKSRLHRAKKHLKKELGVLL